MEEANDRAHATSSPEEMAIHFLLRHAECRSALTGLASEERPYAAPAPPASDGPVTDLVAVNAGRPEESLPSSHVAAAGVTKDDSCTARFLRAYAVARHMRAEADATDRVRSTTMAGSDAESDLKDGGRKSVTG